MFFKEGFKFATASVLSIFPYKIGVSHESKRSSIQFLPLINYYEDSQTGSWQELTKILCHA